MKRKKMKAPKSLEEAMIAERLLERLYLFSNAGIMTFTTPLTMNPSKKLNTHCQNTFHCIVLKNCNHLKENVTIKYVFRVSVEF